MVKRSHGRKSTRNCERTVTAGLVSKLLYTDYDTLLSDGASTVC